MNSRGHRSGGDCIAAICIDKLTIGSNWCCRIDDIVTCRYDICGSILYEWMVLLVVLLMLLLVLL